MCCGSTKVPGYSASAPSWLYQNPRVLGTARPRAWVCFGFTGGFRVSRFGTVRAFPRLQPGHGLDHAGPALPSEVGGKVRTTSEKGADKEHEECRAEDAVTPGAVETAHDQGHLYGSFWP